MPPFWQLGDVIVGQRGQLPTATRTRLSAWAPDGSELHGSMIVFDDGFSSTLNLQYQNRFLYFGALNSKTIWRTRGNADYEVEAVAVSTLLRPGLAVDARSKLYYGSRNGNNYTITKINPNTGEVLNDWIIPNSLNFDLGQSLEPIVIMISPDGRNLYFNDGTEYDGNSFPPVINKLDTITSEFSFIDFNPIVEALTGDFVFDVDHFTIDNAGNLWLAITLDVSADELILIANGSGEVISSLRIPFDTPTEGFGVYGVVRGMGVDLANQYCYLASGNGGPDGIVRVDRNGIINHWDPSVGVPGDVISNTFDCCVAIRGRGGLHGLGSLHGTLIGAN